MKNLAKVIYNAYPDSDLLPIDSTKHLKSLDVLRDHVNTYDIGDNLFKFIVNEIHETLDHDGMVSVLAALHRASNDLSLVIEAVERK